MYLLLRIKKTDQSSDTFINHETHTIIGLMHDVSTAQNKKTDQSSDTFINRETHTIIGLMHGVSLLLRIKKLIIHKIHNELFLPQWIIYLY